MARKSIRPKLFQNNKAPKKYMDNVAHTLIQKTLDSGMKAIQNSNMKNLQVERKPKYIQVTEKRMEQLGVIDLKPYFARSSKAKRTKDGGWHLTVPIPRRSRDMSRRMYEQLRKIDITPNERQTVISDYLYDRRRESDASLLNYTPRSYTIDKIRSGKNRHTYIAFRTVSNKSPISSWILNRGKVTVDNTSKTFVRNVNRVMKWRMKNS